MPVVVDPVAGRDRAPGDTPGDEHARTAVRAALPSVLHRRRWPLFARLVGNGLGQAAAAVASALVVEYAFNELLALPDRAGGAGPQQPPVAWWALATLGGVLVVSAALTAGLRALERVDGERLGQRYVHEVRLVLFERVVRTAPRALQAYTRGGYVVRFTSDLSALGKWVSLGLARLAVSITMAVGALVALAVVDLALAGMAAAAVVLGAAAAVREGPGMREADRETRRRRGRLAANLNEKVATVAVVQAFDQTDRERRRVRRQSRRLQQATVRRARRIGRIRALTEGTAALASAAVLLTGITIGATPGTVAAATTIVGLLVPQLRGLGRVQEYWQASQVAREKILRVLHRPGLLPEDDDAPPLGPGPGRLTFERVSVAGSLSDLDVVAEPGQRVAVVGTNGAGKTTLLAAAARLLDPDAGRVLLDGQDLARHQLSSVRRMVGLVAPDLPLLRGTVERNLRYRWRDAPQAELDRVVRLCGLDDVLEDLSDGLQTRVAESGAGLSAGQRQRIALARALVGDPAVLLLDEADANLDAGASVVVDRIVRSGTCTVLLVTHRPERLAAVDVIWHLRDGRLVETGPPEVLLAGDGPTARLFTAGSTT